MKKSLLFLSVLALLLAFSCGQKSKTVSLKEDPGKALKEFGLSVNDAVFCKNVENYKAVEPAEKFAAEGGGDVKVYILSGIKVDRKGQAITHRFSKLRVTLDGSSEVWQIVHSLKMNVQPSKDFRTYSYITATSGKYRADILASDEKTIIKSIFFEVEGEVSGVQPVDPESTARVELKDAKLCERVEKSMPVNPVTVFNPGPVYVWVETIAESFPTKVFYRWSKQITGLDGTTGWVVESFQSLEIKGKTWRTYAYKNCVDGDYRVDLLSSDAQKVLKTFEFKVGK